MIWKMGPKKSTEEVYVQRVSVVLYFIMFFPRAHYSKHGPKNPENKPDSG